MEQKKEVEKTFKIVGCDISDGYHTFNELYEHRCLLFIAWLVSDGCPGKAYWVAEHFAGWDLVVVEIPHVGQISYHVPNKHRHLYSGRIKSVLSHTFDGHSPTDVLKRIEEWITN